MTTKADFTDQEWKLLTKAVANVTFLIMASDVSPQSRSEHEITQEIRAIYQSVKKGLQSYQHNELVVAVEADKTYLSSEPQSIEGALAEIRQIRTILYRRVVPDEAHEFKQFVIDIATTVANAFIEGENKPISKKERDMLRLIQDALGLDNSS